MSGIKVDMTKINKSCGDMICFSGKQKCKSPICLSSIEDKNRVLLIELKKELLATLESKPNRDLLLLTLVDTIEKMTIRIKKLENIIEKSSIE